MILKVEAINKLIKDKFNNNQTRFSKEISVDRTHLNRVLRSNGTGAGAVICSGIIKFCEKNNLNYKDYIFLE